MPTDDTWITKSGKVLTDADIQALADEAERGYDVEHLKNQPNRIRWRVWRGALSGRIFAAKCRYIPERDAWEAIGEKHDVTEDVERLLLEGLPHD